MLKELKEEVMKANLDLAESGLVILTWGNVSGINREEGFIAIKPSGINYKKMTEDDIVVIDLEGKVVEGDKRPSSDTPTHIELYKAFPEIGGIAHTHSKFAVAFAQACCEVPCLGTTHADNFSGSVPVTRFLTEEEVESDYEKNTGKIIVERFENLNAVSTPGVLVAGHAPFCWGKNAADAVNNCLVLESIAEMSVLTFQLNPEVENLPEYILKKHHNRKHGPDAYYGQIKSK